MKYKYKPFPTRQRMFNVHFCMAGLGYSALYCLHTRLHLNFGLWCVEFDMLCHGAYFIRPSPFDSPPCYKLCAPYQNPCPFTRPQLTVVDWVCRGSPNNRHSVPRPEQPFPGLQLGNLPLWFLLLFLFALLSCQLEGHSGHRGECLCWSGTLQDVPWHLSCGHRQWNPHFGLLHLKLTYDTWRKNLPPYIKEMFNQEVESVVSLEVWQRVWW